MASLKELDETISAYFTLSNKKLLIIARVGEESIYFYDFIDRFTTVILLTEPDCYASKYAFLEFMNDVGATVIDLREKGSRFDKSYKISPRSKKVITTLINNYSYEKIITHPKYDKTYDSQNNDIYYLVTALIHDLGTNNHWTYNYIDHGVIPHILCKFQLKMFEIYSRSLEDVYNENNATIKGYIEIASKIHGLKRV